MDNIADLLINWYQKNKRDLPWRKTNNSYYIWISEIMLQQTRVETVKEYYKKFINRLPTLKDLANINEDELLKLWEGLGYYSRVKNMQKTAIILTNQEKEQLPDTEKELLSLPGIGKYTAGAILSIAYNKPCVAIDGNVYRILGRYYGIEDSISKNSTYQKYEAIIKSILPLNKYSDFTQSFMDLGSAICTPNSPKCVICPLNQQCFAKRENRQKEFPVKEKKKEKKIEERNVYILRYKDKIAIQKRNNQGLLASLYEFPNEENTCIETDIENKLIEKQINYYSVKNIGKSKHIFSHVIWYMQGYAIFLKKPLKNYCWVTKEEIINKYTLPSAFSYFTNLLLQNKI